MAPLVTAGVSNDVAQEVRMPIGPQALGDVEEPMPSRLATLKDPSTPDQIVLDQPWCKVCVESGGRDSPHREQSNIDAVVPQLKFDNDYMEDGGPLRIACFLVEQTPLLEPSTRRGARLQENGHAIRCRNNSQVGAWLGVGTLLSTRRQRSSSVAAGQRGKRMSS